MVRQFLLGFIKVHVLHHATEDKVYGLALIRCRISSRRPDTSGESTGS